MVGGGGNSNLPPFLALSLAVAFAVAGAIRPRVAIYLGTALGALLIVLASAGSSIRVEREDDLTATDFGWPVAFVRADVSRFGFHERVSWNPLEDGPASVDEGAFLSSYAAVVIPLLALTAAVDRLLRGPARAAA